MHARTHWLTSAPHAYTTCTNSRKYPHTETRAARRRTLLDETAREGTCCSTDCGIARAHDSCLCRACQIHTHCHRTATCCTAASITCTSWILVASLCGLSFCAITSALGCGCRAFRRRCEWMGAKLAPEAYPLWLSCAVCIVRSIWRHKLHCSSLPIDSDSQSVCIGRVSDQFASPWLVLYRR